MKIFAAVMFILVGVGCVFAADDAPMTTVKTVTITPNPVKAGESVELAYNFDAPKPLDKSYKVYVHFRDAKGKIVFQGDHMPKTKTDSPEWKGEISYTMKLKVPANVAAGEYNMVIGIYLGKIRVQMIAGEGVTDLKHNQYQVATITVTK